MGGWPCNWKGMSHPLVWDHEPATSLCGRWWILRRSCFIPLILLEATRATGRGEELRVPGDRAWSVHAHHWPLTATPSVRGCWDPEGQSSGKLRRSRGSSPGQGGRLLQAQPGDRILPRAFHTPQRRVALPCQVCHPSGTAQPSLPGLCHHLSPSGGGSEV